MAPDGHWVKFHVIGQPNTSQSPSISNPSLPITFEAIKSGSDSTDLHIFTSSWDAGTAEDPAAFNHEDLKGRQYVALHKSDLSATGNLYTVSPGRVLRLTGGYICATNTSETTTGIILIRDGLGGTVLMPILIPASTKQVTTNTVLPIQLPTALQVKTGVYFKIVSGDIRCSLMLTGYEATY